MSIFDSLGLSFQVDTRSPSLLRQSFVSNVESYLSHTNADILFSFCKEGVVKHNKSEDLEEKSKELLKIAAEVEKSVKSFHDTQNGENSRLLVTMKSDLSAATSTMSDLLSVVETIKVNQAKNESIMAELRAQNNSLRSELLSSIKNIPVSTKEIINHHQSESLRRSIELLMPPPVVPSHTFTPQAPRILHAPNPLTQTQESMNSIFSSEQSINENSRDPKEHFDEASEGMPSPISVLESSVDASMNAYSPDSSLNSSDRANYSCDATSLEGNSDPKEPSKSTISDKSRQSNLSKELQSLSMDFNNRPRGNRLNRSLNDQKSSSSESNLIGKKQNQTFPPHSKPKPPRPVATGLKNSKLRSSLTRSEAEVGLSQREIRRLRRTDGYMDSAFTVLDHCENGFLSQADDENSRTASPEANATSNQEKKKSRATVAIEDTQASTTAETNAVGSKNIETSSSPSARLEGDLVDASQAFHELHTILSEGSSLVDGSPNIVAQLDKLANRNNGIVVEKMDIIRHSNRQVSSRISSNNDSPKHSSLSEVENQAANTEKPSFFVESQDNTVINPQTRSSTRSKGVDNNSDNSDSDGDKDGGTDSESDDVSSEEEEDAIVMEFDKETSQNVEAVVETEELPSKKKKSTSKGKAPLQVDSGLDAPSGRLSYPVGPSRGPRRKSLLDMSPPKSSPLRKKEEIRSRLLSRATRRNPITTLTESKNQAKGSEMSSDIPRRSDGIAVALPDDDQSLCVSTFVSTQDSVLSGHEYNTRNRSSNPAAHVDVELRTNDKIRAEIVKPTRGQPGYKIGGGVHIPGALERTPPLEKAPKSHSKRVKHELGLSTTESVADAQSQNTSIHTTSMGVLSPLPPLRDLEPTPGAADKAELVSDILRQAVFCTTAQKPSSALTDGVVDLASSDKPIAERLDSHTRAMITLYVMKKLNEIELQDDDVSEGSELPTENGDTKDNSEFELDELLLLIDEDSREKVRGLIEQARERKFRQIKAKRALVSNSFRSFVKSISNAASDSNIQSRKLSGAYLKAVNETGVSKRNIHFGLMRKGLISTGATSRQVTSVEKGSINSSSNVMDAANAKSSYLSGLGTNTTMFSSSVPQKISSTVPSNRRSIGLPSTTSGGGVKLSNLVPAPPTATRNTGLFSHSSLGGNPIDKKIKQKLYAEMEKQRVDPEGSNVNGDVSNPTMGGSIVQNNNSNHIERVSNEQVAEISFTPDLKRSGHDEFNFFDENSKSQFEQRLSLGASNNNNQKSSSESVNSGTKMVTSNSDPWYSSKGVNSKDTIVDSDVHIANTPVVRSSDVKGIIIGGLGRRSAVLGKRSADSAVSFKLSKSDIFDIDTPTAVSSRQQQLGEIGIKGEAVVSNARPLEDDILDKTLEKSEQIGEIDEDQKPLASEFIDSVDIFSQDYFSQVDSETGHRNSVSSFRVGFPGSQSSARRRTYGSQSNNPSPISLSASRLLSLSKRSSQEKEIEGSLLSLIDSSPVSSSKRQKVT